MASEVTRDERIDKLNRRLEDLRHHKGGWRATVKYHAVDNPELVSVFPCCPDGHAESGQALLCGEAVMRLRLNRLHHDIGPRLCWWIDLHDRSDPELRVRCPQAGPASGGILQDSVEVVERAALVDS